MEEKVKYIHSQDAYFKVTPKRSGETSLNLSMDILNFITDGTMNANSERSIKFRIFKVDILRGLASIIIAMPLYVSSSKDYHKEIFSVSFFDNMLRSINDFFEDSEEKDYVVNLLYRNDGRIYLNRLKVDGFSIRNFLVEEKSVLHFIKDNGILLLRLESDHEKDDNDIPEEGYTSEESYFSRQLIFYGAPGTGKSHGIKDMLKGVRIENIIRTTFHPDSDYSTFVGAYKPTMKERYRYEANQRVRYPEDDDLAKAKRNDNIVERVIEYDFVPQAFINAYTRAYQTDENVYLIIEEINRGNCAQIFGDLFQLLDRNDDGYSDYTIKADADLRLFLEKELDEDSDGIKDGELCLPPNLYVWATMNTSDQSLFPIDSAFKRRWDWQYIPISYDNTDWKIDIDGNLYSWVDFQRKVNNRIYDATQSEDKKLGDYFVKAVNNVIDKDVLLNKVLFYLWNDVCKDGEGDIFKMKSDEGDKELSFSELYESDGTSKLKMMMDYLGVNVVSPDNDDNEDGENSSGKDYTKYSINGEGAYPKKRLAAELVRKYIQLNPMMSPDEVVSNWNGLGKYVSHFVETQEEYNRRTDSPRVEAVDCQDAKVYVSTNGWGGTSIMDRLMSDVNASPWNLHVEKLTD